MPIFLKKSLQYHNISLHTRQMKYFIKMMYVKIRKLKFKKFKLKPNLKAYMLKSVLKLTCNLHHI